MDMHKSPTANLTETHSGGKNHLMWVSKQNRTDRVGGKKRAPGMLLNRQEKPDTLLTGQWDKIEFKAEKKTSTL